MSEAKTKHIDPLLLQYEANVDLEKEKLNKLNEFKKRIEPFKTIKTFDEAKTLASRILPTANEINRFYVGDVKCTVVNKKDLFRICIDSATEFISYDFSKKGGRNV